MQAGEDPTDVVIVGAGPAGLAAAIELGRRGVRCTVIERNDRVGYSPRAKTTNVRTREFLRRWGIAGKLRDASPISADRPATVVFATRMNGQALARFENALHAGRVRNNLFSEEAQWVPQYVLEDVLRQCAQSLPGVTVRFETEFVSLRQSKSGVVAQVRDARTSAVDTLRSSYLIGADGARSAVRDAIGAVMTGDGGFSRNYSVIFRSPDLNQRMTLEPGLMYWMVNEDVPSMLGPMDEAGLWSFITTKISDDLDVASIDGADLIRRSTGLRDLKIDVLGQDLWLAHRLIADRYSKGRVFLAGDACHLHPPFGGFGMNMGIGDGVDLGWKLAANVAGWGGDTLLASYELERRRVHQTTIDEAVQNFSATGSQLVQPGLEQPGLVGDATRREVGDMILATKQREFNTLGIVLGARYEGSPVIVADGSAPPPDHPMIYTPSAHPGCLAPHLWLADGSSLYDHFGDGFCLLLADGGDGDAKSLVAAAAKRGVPLSVLALADTRLRRRYGARFTLIRPDQYVAWRGDLLPADCDAMLARVTGAAVPATAKSSKRPSKKK